ncbi:MAG: 50S ribosomal protein L22 [Candidatus Daviesbacteria bacterium]|nr:MAG: 50S ribosomal protein L22 [Candidatus Daviesbacteria bacterium]
METIHIQKYIHRSPRKLRLVVDMVRKAKPNKAIEILNFTQNYGAKDLVAAIQTALANASQKGLVDEVIYFKSIEVNGAPVMKRFRAGTKGRAKPYARRMSHIKIVLSDEKKVNQEIPSKKAARGDPSAGGAGPRARKTRKEGK